jgi:hypothetical protein
MNISKRHKCAGWGTNVVDKGTNVVDKGTNVVLLLLKVAIILLRYNYLCILENRFIIFISIDHLQSLKDPETFQNARAEYSDSRSR